MANADHGDEPLWGHAAFFVVLLARRDDARRRLRLVIRSMSEPAYRALVCHPVRPAGPVCGLMSGTSRPFGSETR